jgi:aryl-alcohol dehydrogenase-like predicted oxidoreductase
VSLGVEHSGVDNVLTNLIIPGTSSVAHLRENVTGAGLTLSEDDLAELTCMAS